LKCPQMPNEQPNAQRHTRHNVKRSGKYAATTTAASDTP
jgi:hypothetical protein